MGLNAFFWRQPATGSGQYLKHLVQGLAKLEAGGQFLLVSPRDPDRLPAQWPEGIGYSETETPFSALSRQLDKVWFEQLSVPRACYAGQVDLIHYPYFAAPLRSNLPVVVTVHDLIPLILPPYRGGIFVEAYTRLVSAATRRATAIIADSECSRRDIVKLLNVPEERVSVVYLAASERYRPLDGAAEIESIRRKYSLDGPFVLYLGGLDYRKNVPRLVEAFAEVLRRGEGGPSFPLDLRLVVVGDIPGPSPLFPDVRGQVANLGLGDRVRLLGRVPEDDSPWLYNAAAAFVFPSLYEGFGLPPLEALACGTPVVCSNTSSLPEVVGDAAVMVNPEDIKALAEALERVLIDEALRRELRERGLRRARQFNWQKTAAETWAVYLGAVRAGADAIKGAGARCLSEKV